MRLIGSAFAGLLLATPALEDAQAETPFLATILLQSKASVARELGPPLGCRAIKAGEKCIYRDGQVEIVFIKGKADWITYNDPPVGFFPAALNYLGVKCPVALDKINFAGGLITWNGTCPGILTAVLAPGEGPSPIDPVNRRLEYLFIKAATP